MQATLYRDVNRHPSVQLELLGVPLSAMTVTSTEVAQQDLLGRLANRLSDLETGETANGHAGLGTND